jgi:hypothetical protein
MVTYKDGNRILVDDFSDIEIYVKIDEWVKLHG